MVEVNGELLLVTHRDPVEWHGGGPTYVRSWARAAQCLGIRPRIVTLSDRSEVRASPYGTVHRVRSPLGRTSSLTLSVTSPLLGRAALDILADRPGTHVVHGFSGWPRIPAGDVRAMADRGVTVRLVQTAWTTMRHEIAGKLASGEIAGSARVKAWGEALWSRLANDRVQHSSFRDSSCVLVNYRTTERILREQWPETAFAIRHMPYLAESAFDTGPLPTRSPDPSVEAVGAPAPPMIVAMSRHTARKGLGVLIRALHLLSGRGIDFRACLPSEGPLLHSHRARVAQLGLADRVMLPGLVDSPTDYIRAADVFVLPSLEEGSGSVSVLEALQATVPVVASDVDGMHEDITDDVDGILVPPGDASALAQAIQDLITDPARRRRIALAGRRLYERRFSPDVVVPAIGELYGELGLLTDMDARH